MTKFERFVCERFGNILKRSFKGHKNNEINMLSVLLANNGLIPFETVHEKERDCFGCGNFFDIFVNADVVNTQTRYFPLKSCRATLIK